MGNPRPRLNTPDDEELRAERRTHFIEQIDWLRSRGFPDSVIWDAYKEWRPTGPGYPKDRGSARTVREALPAQSTAAEIGEQKGASGRMTITTDETKQ